MAKRTVERKVVISERDLPSFLDMLRYDGATVTGWSSVDPGNARNPKFEVVLRSSPDRTTGFEFTAGRWESFGMYLKDMEGNPAR